MQLTTLELPSSSNWKMPNDNVVVDNHKSYTATMNKTLVSQIRTIAYITVALLLHSCASEQSNSDIAAKGTLCPAAGPTVRVQACTMEYRPVCASLGDGTTQEFGNACTACSNPSVIAYVENICGI